MRRYFEELKELKPDALIIADPAVFTIAREVCPEIDVHISTQANNTNYGTYNFWHGLGATRVVSARELSLKEIKEIRQNIPDDRRSRLLSMGLCAFPIPADACSAIILPDEMPTVVPVPILAAGNTRW